MKSTEEAYAIAKEFTACESETSHKKVRFHHPTKCSFERKRVCATLRGIWKEVRDDA